MLGKINTFLRKVFDFMHKILILCTLDREPLIYFTIDCTSIASIVFQEVSPQKLHMHFFTLSKLTETTLMNRSS